MFSKLSSFTSLFPSNPSCLSPSPSHISTSPLGSFSQGQYSFFVFDGVNKQALAARDPSGEQELYYMGNQEGSVSFTNSLEQLPKSEQSSSWVEVPPGHYVSWSGRTASLHQFALTPEQLGTRERDECASLSDQEEEFSTGSPKSATSALNVISRLSRVIDRNSW